MKITKTAVLVFLVAFLAGDASVLPDRKNFRPVESEISESSPPIIPVETMPEKEVINEKINWKEEKSKLNIKLLESGRGFHGDEVNAKSGETWIGLFKENKNFFLRTTKLKVLPDYDAIFDDVKEKIKTGKSVFTNKKGNSVFLLKNARMLSEGEIKTVFFAEDIEQSTEFRNGSQKNFEFNGANYNLRIENKLTTDEFLSKGSKLILSRNGTEQILSYLPEGCNDCYWNLYWAGDLDQDGKLDFYFDLSAHYNVTDKKLFLSSQAGKGKLVKYIANFATTGC